MLISVLPSICRISGVCPQVSSAFNMGACLAKALDLMLNLCKLLELASFYVRVRLDGVWLDGIFYKVLLIPNLRSNLFSVRAAAQRGVTFSFAEDRVVISRRNRTLAVGTSRHKDLYVLDVVA